MQQVLFETTTRCLTNLVLFETRRKCFTNLAFPPCCRIQSMQNKQNMQNIQNMQDMQHLILDKKKVSHKSGRSSLLPPSSASSSSSLHILGRQDITLTNSISWKRQQNFQTWVVLYNCSPGLSMGARFVLNETTKAEAHKSKQSTFQPFCFLSWTRLPLSAWQSLPSRQLVQILGFAFTDKELLRKGGPLHRPDDLVPGVHLDLVVHGNQPGQPGHPCHHLHPHRPHCPHECKRAHHGSLDSQSRQLKMSKLTTKDLAPGQVRPTRQARLSPA